MNTGYLAKKIESVSNAQYEPERNYIGASSIGSECLRQIWYDFNHAESEDIGNKLRRTWDIGKRLEGMILNELINAEIVLLFPSFDFKDSEYDYFQGHVDGIMEVGEKTAILEIKTANDSSFKNFVKNGLLLWQQKYYAQLQAYMGMSGIHTGYIIVLNKNTSELWDEFVEFDAEYYESLRQKARIVYEAKEPLPRVHNSPSWWQCKMCRFRKVCHE